MDRVAFETARLELARLQIKPAGGQLIALESALKLCARTVRVERVSYWELSPDGERLVCRLVYTRSLDQVSAGDVLVRSRYPAYWAALSDKRVIAAHDASAHPATAELWTSYLQPLGIGAMLDAPVYRAGEICGVVCHEHVGAPRTWTAEEIGFVSSVADLVSMLLEQGDRLAAEERLRLHIGNVVASEKLAVLEDLSRAVAHDFANLIMAVEMVAARLRRRGGEDEDLSSGLESVAHVAGDLLGQLRRFGARRTGAPAALPLGQVVERIAPILSTLTRGIAELTVEIAVGPDDLPAITADKVEQIILNLTLNARDAIDIHGRVALRARVDGDVLLIEVADDGIGMTPAMVQQIWEPYFTTKPTGTGLGLATVRAIVADAGGTIEVDSTVGKGTTFRVRLPRATPQ